MFNNVLTVGRYDPKWKIETLDKKFNMSFKYEGEGYVKENHVYLYSAFKSGKCFIIAIDDENRMYNPTSKGNRLLGDIHTKKEITLKGQ